jgi:glycosyltransferase involved in cell wall biosynthesis
MKAAAVIPAFNTKSSIGEVVRRTLPFVDKVVVVDDGSSDDTAAEAKAVILELLFFWTEIYNTVQRRYQGC